MTQLLVQTALNPFDLCNLWLSLGICNENIAKWAGNQRELLI